MTYFRKELMMSKQKVVNIDSYEFNKNGYSINVQDLRLSINDNTTYSEGYSLNCIYSDKITVKKNNKPFAVYMFFSNCPEWLKGLIEEEMEEELDHII